MRPPGSTEFRPPKPSNIYRSGVAAHVKWFAPEKGFGFVTLDDGSGEAFLHASALAEGGYDTLVAGQALVCDVAPGQKGPQVSVIHSAGPAPAVAPPRSRRVGDSPRPGARPGAASLPPRTGATAGGNRRSDAPMTRSGPREVEGTVKFYSPEKGFGFITPDRGSKDIFVHQTTLRRSGLEALQPRVRVRVRIQETDRGPEADKVEFL